MAQAPGVAALILAGGHGRRMGRTKHDLRLGDRTLLEHALDRARPVFAEIFISGPAAVAPAGLPVLPDPPGTEGPLAGVLAGLQAASAPWLFVLPCDSPLVPESFLRGMIAEIRPDCDAVVPCLAGLWEPLHALYSKSCLPPIRAQVQAGERKIVEFYDRVRVRAIGQDRMAIYDPEGLAFLNLNTPGDLERAKELIERNSTR